MALGALVFKIVYIFRPYENREKIVNQYQHVNSHAYQNRRPVGRQRPRPGGSGAGVHFVEYKVALMGYRVLHGLAPQYLDQLVPVADLPGVEFYLYPTVGTVLIHSVKPELTE